MVTNVTTINNTKVVHWTISPIELPAMSIVLVGVAVMVGAKEGWIMGTSLLDEGAGSTGVGMGGDIGMPTDGKLSQ